MEKYWVWLQSIDNGIRLIAVEICLRGASEAISGNITFNNSYSGKYDLELECKSLELNRKV